MGVDSTVSVKAPVRVDIAGGTLDIYPVYNILGSSLTVNFAIDLFSRVKIRTREKEGVLLRAGKGGAREFAHSHAIENKGELALVSHVFRYFQPCQQFSLTIDSDAPKGSGLGSSSSLIVSLLTAAGRFLDNAIPVKNLFHVASEIESSLIHMVTGKQDYVPAIFGGLNFIRFSPGKTQMMNVKRNKGECRWLERLGFLAFTGVSHVSARENWLLVKRLIDGGRKGREKFDRLLALAEEASAAISGKDPEKLADVMEREWAVRKGLSRMVTVESFEKFKRHREVRKLIHSARLCGAGGGGTMFAICRPGGDREKLTHMAMKAGFSPIPFSIAGEMEVRIGGKRARLL